MEYKGNNKLYKVQSGPMLPAQIDAFARKESNRHQFQCNYKCETIQRYEILTFPLLSEQNKIFLFI
jgi:hypothetical protein